MVVWPHESARWQGLRVRAFVAIALAACVLTATVRAQETSEDRLLLVRSAGDDAIVARLRAELNQSAWQTRELRVRGPRAADPLATLARAAGARAALRVHAPQMRIELWVAPRAPGQPESVEWLSSEG